MKLAAGTSRKTCLLEVQGGQQVLSEVLSERAGSFRRTWLERAVDHEGDVLEAVVTTRRNKAAALKFLKKLMKRDGCAEEIVSVRFVS